MRPPPTYRFPKIHRPKGSKIPVQLGMGIWTYKNGEVQARLRAPKGGEGVKIGYVVGVEENEVGMCDFALINYEK